MKFFGKGTTSRFVEDPEEKREKLVKVRDCLKSPFNLFLFLLIFLQFFTENIHNKYNIYYFGFMACELLNFVVVVISFFLTHRFLNHRFIFYGFQVWVYYQVKEMKLN